MSHTERALQNLALHLGQETPGIWQTGLPVLAGEAIEQLFPEAVPCGKSGLFSLYKAGGFLFGVAHGESTADMTENTFKVYRDLFQATQPRKHLCRIWNYVPGINQTDGSGLEQYRAFCKGRALAFASQFGASYERQLPAASAVGTDAQRLLVLFAAHDNTPEHLENPLQTPAYHYPASYGPRPPGFARASVLMDGQLRHIFISGTAAIRGHQTVASGDTLGQVTCTVENLQAILERCGLASCRTLAPRMQCHAKIYLRNPADTELVENVLQQGLLQADTRISYLRSDICRSDLNVEIELTLLNAPRH